MSPKLARLVAAVALLSLPCSTYASLRLEGIGSDLAGIVDDPVTDLLRYPQLNALTSGWLTGIELLSYDGYHLYGRSHGPISIAGAVDATLSSSYGTRAMPSGAVAASRGRWSFGAALTACNLRRAPQVPPFYVPGDTEWRWAAGSTWDVGDGSLGARWTNSAFALDGMLGARVTRWVGWVGVPPDTCVLSADFIRARITPGLRLTLVRGQVCWRWLASYGHTFYHVHDYESTYSGVSRRPASGHQASLAGGLTYAPNRALLVATALQIQDSLGVGASTWAVRLPAGLEWTGGPFTLRLGAEASVLLTASGGLKAEFDRAVYCGLGIRPTQHITIDLVPSLDDAANLRGWQLGARADF